MFNDSARRWFFLSVGLGLAVLFASPALGGESGEAIPSCPGDARWGLIVDAGSSGSRLRFYCWRDGKDGALPWIEDVGSRRLEPGLADPECSRSPTEALEGLNTLIDQAKEIVGPERSAETPLRLMATAGLRQCPADYQEAMLAEINEAFAKTPFATPQAQVISGAEEGRYGWIGVNYLLGQLDAEDSSATAGALDLGGGSTQITFMPRSCTGAAEVCGEIEVGGRAFPLYTRSYLGWGQDRAMKRVASPACDVRGYPGHAGSKVGRGKYRACRRAIRGAIRQARRSEPSSCVRSCNRLGVYQPPLVGDFVAFSAFAYNTEYFGLDAQLTLEQLRDVGREYCRTPWQETLAECGEGCNEEWLNRYCFTSAYIVTLLHDVYGFPMNQRFTSSHELEGGAINWTLGAMVQMAEELSKKPER